MACARRWPLVCRSVTTAEVQAFAVYLHDHEPGLDGVAGRQVFAGADDHAARGAIGLLDRSARRRPRDARLPMPRMIRCARFSSSCWARESAFGA